MSKEKSVSFAELAKMLNNKSIGVVKKKRKANGKNKSN
jgi:hypothetical protein|tara:strand:+ start:398 stop:511 length:114 start_codon:yes stop_codon:yes gene_type:complete